MAQVWWEITGKLVVEESSVTGELATRALEGVEVEVEASNFGRFDSWGTVRTNSNGEFSLRKEKDRSKRKIKVKVRLASSQLEVNTGLLGGVTDFISPAINVFEHSQEVEGPNIPIGTRTFKAGASGELGDLETRRRAVTWYVCKTLIDTLVEQDPYFAFKDKIKVIYPAKVVSGSSYANQLTRSAYIHASGSTDQWTVQTVLHEVMHLWNYDHNHGTANWFGAVFCPPDLNTHSQAERRPIAFHEGFAEFASWELLHVIWGMEKKKPYGRYALLHELHLDTVDEVEQNDDGVYRALCLLAGRAIYQRKFGDKNTRPTHENYPYPEKAAPVLHSGRAAPVLLKCPENPKLTLWDVLKVFQANSNVGLTTEWQVGNNDYGVRRFFERARTAGKLDEATKDLFLSLIDPNNTEEPQDRCTAAVVSASVPVATSTR